MNQPLISVILVTYNSGKYIESCLKSVLNNTYSNFEIIILDNNSSDTTPLIIKEYKKKYPTKIRAIFEKKNLGYSAGNNLAVTYSKADFVFILNPDTVVSRDFLTPLIKEIKKEDVAAVQPLVYLFDKKTINLSGKVTQFIGFDWLKDFKATTIPKKQRIYSFSGSGVLINKNYFLLAGGFDELYFMYYEDSDLSWKFNLLDKKILFTPESILFHDYKYKPEEKYQSFKQKLFYIERNRLITVLKNYSLTTLFLLLPVILFMEAGLILFAFYEGWGLKKLQTYSSIFNNFKTIYKNRQFIQAKRIVSDRKILQNLESKITFEKFSNVLIKHLANPIFEIYFNIIKKVI